MSPITLSWCVCVCVCVYVCVSSLLLLLGGCEASRLRGIRSAGEMVSQPDSAVDNVRYVEGSECGIVVIYPTNLGKTQV